MTFPVKSLQLRYPHERLIRRFFYLLILLGAVYIYLINSMIFNAVSREKFSQQIDELTSQVATLESRYVALSGRVTLELARGLGFEDTANHTGFAYEGRALWNENL